MTHPISRSGIIIVGGFEKLKDYMQYWELGIELIACPSGHDLTEHTYTIPQPETGCKEPGSSLRNSFSQGIPDV
jgi:hypothetical protein